MTISRRGPARVAVEGVAIGAAPFDGNQSNRVVSWMFSNPDWIDDQVPAMLDQLMEYTKWGHLAWVCFPKEGYRL